MKIVVLEGYAANPGDLSWGEIEQFGDLTAYDRGCAEELEERANANLNLKRNNQAENTDAPMVFPNAAL